MSSATAQSGVLVEEVPLRQLVPLSANLNQPPEPASHAPCTGSAQGTNDSNSHDGPQEITDSSSWGLAPLEFKPTSLQTWMLTTCIALNLGVIIILCLVLSISTPLNGSDFILGGAFAGFVSAVAKFLVTQQGLSIGQIMPYCSMASPNDDGTTFEKTLDADYWPYEWPVVRLRAFRNGHYFFYFVNLVSMLSVLTVVQFASNTFRAVDDEYDDLMGYLPKKGIIYIVIACFATFALVTIATLLWLWNRKTSLLAAPGSIALYMALLQKPDFHDEYRGIEGECRRWVVRDRLRANRYKIGYWKDSENIAVYGIRKPTGIAISAALLAAALSTALTLLIHDDILTYGFPPGVSTALTPFVEISPAGFLWSFFPSLAADQYRLLVKSIDTFHRLAQPYTDLRRSTTNAPHTLTALTLNYASDLPLLITFRALRNRHWKVALLSFFSLISSLIPTFAANMFYPASNGLAIQINTTFFRFVLAYIPLLILVLLAAIPDETRHMPHDIETISDHASLFSQSSLLSNGKYQYIPLRSQPPQPVVKRQGFLAFARASLSSWKGALLAKLETFRFSYLSPPVKKVYDALKALDADDMPRLGTWQREDKSFAVGVESKKEMLSMFGADNYRLDFRERMVEAFL